ncbi:MULTISPECIES: AAA family ATPase [unclassified Streptomyces]|uniref:AAA family ATPase n=1 Tax=unclassified Streptomyces TaxID=2593676 RepID=UPI0013DA4DD4|nr:MULTISPECIES: AAA family ATPase [unclassified Streptomyces]
MAVRSLIVGSGVFPPRITTEDDYWDNQTPFTPLASVDAAVDKVAHALRRAGVLTAPPVLHPDILAANSAFRHLQERAGGDAVIVHFCGHGAIKNNNLYLALQGSDPRTLPTTAWKASELLDSIEDSDGTGPALFFLDVCGAGKALAAQIAQQASADRRKAWVIAACREGEFTSDARFSHASAAVLDRLAKGWLDLSPALSHVPVDTLAAEIDRELAHTGRDGYEQTVVRTPHSEATVQVPPFLRNPSHTTDPRSLLLSGLEAELRQIALDTDPGLDPVHFATRAAGTKRTDTCLFSGRTTELGSIEKWLDGDHTMRLMMLYGSPGSGKSALLGLTTCLLHPSLTPLFRGRMANRVPGFRPRLRARVLAVHARQLTSDQIARTLLRQLADQAPSVDLPDSNPDSERSEPERDGTSNTTPLSRLTQALRQVGPTVVIVDALDEAEEPARILRELVLPLSGHGANAFVPNCRVLIGTRPWWDIFPELKEIAEAGKSAAINLDTQRRDALAGDLEQYLKDFFYFNDCDHTPETARAIARRLADNAESGAFLIAALYAEHLLVHGPEITAAQAIEEVPYRITQAFDLQTAELTRANAWIRPVLKALGHARGLGLPLDLIHAGALALQPASTDELAPEVTDTREALRQAYSYLRTSTDTDGRLLYRYFHQALVDHTAVPSDEAAIHEAFLGVVPKRPDGSLEWEFAHPYLKRHAAAHARASGPAALDALLSDPAFLVHADPDELRLHLPSATSPEAQAYVRIYRTTTAHHPRRHDPLVRRSFLSLDAASWQDPALAQAFAVLPIEQQTTQAIPRWATNRTADTAKLHTLTSRNGVTTAVAATTLGNMPVAFTSNRGGQVVLWDLATGQRLRTLANHDGAITSVATSTLGDHSVAITGDAFGNGLVWDLVTGQRVRLLGRPVAKWANRARQRMSAIPLRTHAVTSVASARLTDGPAAVMSAGQEVIVWDLDTAKPLRPLPGGQVTGSSGVVFAVATGTLNDRPIVVTSGWGGWILVWDLETGECLNRLTSDQSVYAVATATLSDGQSVAVFTEGKKVIVWNLETGERLHTLVGHQEAVYAVATTEVHGRPAAVTSGKEGQVIIWDLESGKRTRTLAGHNREVRAIATSIVENRPVAITGSADGRATVWDLELPDRVTTTAGHAGEVLSVAMTTVAGRLAAVTCGKDPHTIVWDLATGKRLHTLTGPDEQTNAVTTALLRGRPIAVTSGWSGRVSVWDLEEGEHMHVLHDDDLLLYALATTTMDNRPAVATGSTKGTLLVWDLESAQRLRTLDGHDGLVYSIATATLTLGDRIDCPIAVTSGADGLVIVWDLESAQRLRTLDGHDGLVYSIATATLTLGDRIDCPIAVTSGEDGLIVWDLTTGQRLRVMGGDHRTVPPLATATVDGHPVAVTGTSDGDVIVWDLATGRSSTAAILPHSMSSAAVSDVGLVLGHREDIAFLAWHSLVFDTTSLAPAST